MSDRQSESARRRWAQASPAERRANTEKAKQRSIESRRLGAAVMEALDARVASMLRDPMYMNLRPGGWSPAWSPNRVRKVLW